jgi:hypothetical protein
MIVAVAGIGDAGWKVGNPDPRGSTPPARAGFTKYAHTPNVAR